MSELLEPSIARQFDRLPPHDTNAEMAMLGSLALCDGDRGTFARVLAIVDRDMLFQADNQIVFDALCSMYRAGKKIDGVTLRAHLQAHQLLEEIGGQAYLGQILNSVPSYQHAAGYAEIVREKALRRRLISTPTMHFARRICRPISAPPRRRSLTWR
jgi:replicative DNA helicase